MNDYLTHTTSEGDRWDLLAWTYYGDVSQIQLLAAANPSVSLDPILAAGITLVIPIIEAPAPDTAPGLPPWRA
jgi:phage tail protein X